MYSETVICYFLIQHAVTPEGCDSVGSIPTKVLRLNLETSLYASVMVTSVLLAVN